jgi:hypothetical protein
MAPGRFPLVLATKDDEREGEGARPERTMSRARTLLAEARDELQARLPWVVRFA